MPGDEPIRVFVVDDHEIVRLGVRVLLSVHDDLELVGEASSGEEAIRSCAESRPHVVLMDLTLPGMGGVAATRALRELCPNAAVLAMSGQMGTEAASEAMQAGAVGYLFKAISGEQLIAAIRAASTGSRLFLSYGVPALPLPTIDNLTPRQRQVLALLAQGLGSPEIAERLGVSLATVNAHVHRILARLRVASRAEAGALARR